MKRDNPGAPITDVMLTFVNAWSKSKMQTSKFRLVLLLAVVLLLTVSLTAPAVAQDQPTETYGMVVFLKGSEFFNWAYAGMRDAAALLGANVEVQLLGPAEWDASLEAREIEQLMARGVDGIIATAGDAQTMNSAIDRAVENGIPVVLFDSDAPESQRLSFVGTNNYNAGCEAGRAVAEWRGDDAVVGISTFPGPDHLARRVQGFQDCLLAAAPGATIAQVVNDEGRVDRAETAITAMLQANPEVNVIFAAHGNPGPVRLLPFVTLACRGKLTSWASTSVYPCLNSSRAARSAQRLGRIRT